MVSVRLWDASASTERRMLRGHSRGVNVASFSPDGRLIASASHDGMVRLWDASTGTERRVYEANTSLRYLSFCGSCLVTDCGVFQLPESVLRHHHFASKVWLQEMLKIFSISVLIMKTHSRSFLAIIWFSTSTRVYLSYSSVIISSSLTDGCQVLVCCKWDVEKLNVCLVVKLIFLAL